MGVNGPVVLRNGTALISCNELAEKIGTRIEYDDLNNMYWIIQFMDSKAYLESATAIRLNNTRVETVVVPHKGTSHPELEYALEAPSLPEIIDGHLMIPLEAVPAAFHSRVECYMMNNTAYIEYVGLPLDTDEKKADMFRIITDRMPNYGQSPTPSTSPQSASVLSSNIEGLRQQFFDLVNGERSKAGAPALVKNYLLMQAAQARAEVMAQHKICPDDHNLPGLGSLTDTLNNRDITTYRHATESTATAYNPEGVLAAWMASDLGYWECMLDCIIFEGEILDWKNAGVGVAKDSDGLYYWVLVFSR